MTSRSSSCNSRSPSGASAKGLLLAVALIGVLSGCTDRATNAPTADAIPVGSDNAEASDQAQGLELLGVYPKRQPLVLETTCNAFATFADASHVVCANGNDAELWDMTTGRRVMLLAHPEPVIALAVAPDQQALLTVTAGRESPVRLWDLKSSELVRKYTFPPTQPDPNPQPAEKGSDQWCNWRSSVEWGMHRSLLVPENGFGFTSVAFAPGGGTFAAGREDGAILIWDIDGDAPTIRLPGTDRRAWSIVFSPHASRLLCTCRDDVVQLWDPVSGTLVRKYVEKRERNWLGGRRIPLAFSSDGSKFAFYSPQSQAIRICESATGHERRQLADNSKVHGYQAISHDGCIAFLPGNNRLLSNSGWQLKKWDLDAAKTTHFRTCRSGVNPSYAYPNVKFVRYLPGISAVMAVEVANDENTSHADWTTIRIVPLSQFWDATADTLLEDCHCRIRFPWELLKFVGMEYGREESLKRISYSCKLDGALYSVAMIVHPDRLPKSARQEIVSLLLERMRQGEFQLTKDEATTAGTIAGRKWSLINTEKGIRVHSLVFLRDNLEYHVSVRAKRDMFPVQRAEAFFRSFSFREQP